MTDGPTDALAGSEAANQSRKPLIVLCAPEHPDLLETQFARYVHEYDVRTTASAAETSELLQGSGTRGPGRHARLRDRGARRARDVGFPLLAGLGAHGEANHRRPRQPVPRPGRRAASWPRHRQVRRLPADATRRTGRGVPQRRDRAPLRLGIDGARRTDRAHRLRTARLADGRAAGLRLPDGDAGGGRHARVGHRPRGAGPARRQQRPAGGLRPRRRHHATPLSAGPRCDSLRRPGRHRRGQGRRPGRRRGGSRRAGLGGLRVVGGAADRRDGVRRRRWAGGDELDDPQLPGLSARDLRHAAGSARPEPGDQVRHALLHRLARREACRRNR